MKQIKKTAQKAASSLFSRPMPLSSSLFPAMFISILSLLAWAYHSVDNVFSYQFDAVAQGEVWRLLTAHFFHTNTAHLVMNLGALWAMFFLHKTLYRAYEYVFVFIFSAIGCLGLLFTFSPDIPHYVGLSGVIHGVLLFYAFKEVKLGVTSGWLIILGVILKIAFEQVSGPSKGLEAAIGARVIIDGHLYGAIMGGLSFLIFLMSTYKK